MSDTIKAALWMMGTVLSFTSMAIAGREVSIDLGTFELMMYRSFIGMAVVVCVAMAAGTLGQVSLRHMRLHILRNICHFTGQNLWFYAVALIPFAQLFALEFSVPVWVALAAPLFLSEPLTRVRVAAALVGFAGILMVAQPGATSFSPGVIAAFLCAFGFAGSVIATKILTRTESVTCILFWMTVTQAVMGVIASSLDGKITVPAPGAIPWVALVGLAGLCAHFCLTRALLLAPAIVVAPFDFIRLPLIAVVGMLFYAEPLDLLTLVGAGVILGANYMNLRCEARRRKEESGSGGHKPRESG